MSTYRRSVVARYLFVIVVVAVATLLRLALEPVLDARAPFILYFPAVVACAWFGAFWPGILSTALSAVVTWYLFIPPQYSFSSSDPTAPAQLVIFLVGGVFMSLLAESFHRARGKVEISEAREREQHERFRVTLASIGDAVIATDSSGRVEFMNPVAETLTGWISEQALGKPLDEVFNIVNEQTRMPVQNPALRAMREGRIFGLANHTILINKNGGEIPIDDSGSPIADSNGGVRGAVLIFRDITGRRKAEEARATLAAIVQSSEDAIISKTIDGTISSWNPAAERMFEYTAAEAIGHPITIIVPPDRLEEESFILDRIREGERITSLETVRQSKNGELLDISVTISPVRDSSGRIVGASKIIRDITERKRVEERFRVAVESAPNAVIMVNQEGRIILINAQATQLFGYEPDEIVGQPVELLVPERYRHSHPEHRGAFSAAPQNRSMGAGRDLYGLRKDGTEVPIEIGLNPISVHGETLVLSSIVDISERKHAEQERAQLLASESAARQQAEAAGRAKDQFLAMVSHELRSPLNAVLGWTQLLRSGTFSGPETSRALETIERNAKSQVGLIEDLLDISRVISGRLVLEVHPVEIASIISSAIESIRVAAEVKSIELESCLEPAKNWVLGDPNRLQQIVWNLLSNAVKFTPVGGHVKVRAHRTNADIEIIVSDSGVGISPDFLPHVFETFSQASSTSDRRYGGLGLGMSIVRHLVELHGGTVRAESPGEFLGATFTVTLPLEAVLEQSDRLSLPTAEGKVPLPVNPVILKGLRILIVEDEPDTRDLLEAMLVGSGAEVRTCSSVPEALATLEQWRPSLLMSDIGLPGEDGYSLIKKVRAIDGAGGDIPAIAVTGYARSEDRTRALAAGFQTHVPKPVDASELVTVVASLIGRRSA